MADYWYKTKNGGGAVAVTDIPVVPYARFFEEMSGMLPKAEWHCASYFAAPDPKGLKFYCLMLDDSNGDVCLTSWEHDYYEENVIASLTAVHASMHPYEREIAERYGLEFSGNPYARPIRFAHDRADRRSTMNNYPFYSVEGHSVHEVNVGPVHAGIIEPGVFRFICNGEEVMHLEIVLGYQHRGVESLMAATSNRLRQVALAESIAGDTAVSHATAYCMTMEALKGFSDPRLDTERAVAAELERIAMHIADTGALCMDVGYQLGQVACEALRTVVINTTQAWCGNRFGKALIRPFGTNFPLTDGKRAMVLQNIETVKDKYNAVCEDLLGSPSVLSRFEDCGVVSMAQMQKIGGVGVAAKASGLARDIRSTHPYGAYGGTAYDPVSYKDGDVMARLNVRYSEVLRSSGLIASLLEGMPAALPPKPDYFVNSGQDMLSFSLVEGWRGEICHVALTDADGDVAQYKIKDPSVHNWYALSLAVRGAGISDFPICNKSFNLSYCGHDL